LRTLTMKSNASRASSFDGILLDIYVSPFACSGYYIMDIDR
jgi:hypothetical protein